MAGFPRKSVAVILSLAILLSPIKTFAGDIIVNQQKINKIVYKGVEIGNGANEEECRDALCNALKYSGLGITEDMTFTEICAILTEKYPAIFNLITNTDKTWWGGNIDTITYNGSTLTMHDEGRDNSIKEFYAYMKTPIMLMDNPVLTFDAKCSAGSGGYCTYNFYLEISTDGSNWSTLLSQQKYLDDYGTVSAELNCSEKSLMNYAGKKAYFRLRVSVTNNLYGGATFNITKFETK